MLVMLGIENYSKSSDNQLNPPYQSMGGFRILLAQFPLKTFHSIIDIWVCDKEIKYKPFPVSVVMVRI